MEMKDKLNKLRGLLGLSIAKMAEESDVAQGTLSTYFSGTTKSISFTSMMRIMTRYNIDANAFYAAEDIVKLDDVRLHPPASAAPSAPTETNAAKPAHLSHGRPRVVIANMDKETAEIARKAIKEVFEDQAFQTMQGNVKWFRKTSGILGLSLIGIVIVFALLVVYLVHHFS